MNARDAIEDIKRYAPASLKVTLQDGTEKAVAVPKAGNRWSRLSQVLDALLWVQIECLDKDSKLLGVIEDDEDILVDGEDDEGGTNIALARVLMDVMRTTMKETRLMFDAQLRGQAELLTAMTEGMRHVSESYNQALKVQQAHLLAPQASEGGDSAEMMRMMQMGMAMMANQPKVGP
jgi:hypothetical protein